MNLVIKFDKPTEDIDTYIIRYRIKGSISYSSATFNKYISTGFVIPVEYPVVYEGFIDYSGLSCKGSIPFTSTVIVNCSDISFNISDITDSSAKIIVQGLDVSDKYDLVVTQDSKVILSLTGLVNPEYIITNLDKTTTYLVTVKKQCAKTGLYSKEFSKSFITTDGVKYISGSVKLFTRLTGSFDGKNGTGKPQPVPDAKYRTYLETLVTEDTTLRNSCVVGLEFIFDKPTEEDLHIKLALTSRVFQKQATPGAQFIEYKIQYGTDLVYVPGYSKPTYFYDWGGAPLYIFIPKGSTSYVTPTGYLNRTSDDYRIDINYGMNAYNATHLTQSQIKETIDSHYLNYTYLVTNIYTPAAPYYGLIGKLQECGLYFLITNNKVKANFRTNQPYLSVNNL